LVDDLGINPSKYAERGIKNNKVAEQVLNAKLSNRQANLRLVRKINSCENMNDKSCRRLYSFVYNEKIGEIRMKNCIRTLRQE